MKRAATAAAAVLATTFVATLLACAPPPSSSSSPRTQTPIVSSAVDNVHARYDSADGYLDMNHVVAEGEGVGEGEGEGEGEGVVEPPQPTFVAVGYGGRRMSSADGATWTHDDADADADTANGGDDDNLLRDVCFGDGAFVAVGGSQRGRVLMTSDGATWTTALSDANGWLGGCAVGDGVVVAAGSSRAIRSVDGGATWGDPSFHLDWRVRDVAFANGVFVAVGDAGAFSSEDDGVTWTQRASTSLQHVTGGATGFVAVGNGQRAMSADGAAWSFASSASKDVVWDGARFVCVGVNVVETSNGDAWDVHETSVALDVVGGTSGSYVSSTWPSVRRTSSDALSWSEPQPDSGNNPITSIVYGSL